VLAVQLTSHDAPLSCIRTSCNLAISVSLLCTFVFEGGRTWSRQTCFGQKVHGLVQVCTQEAHQDYLILFSCHLTRNHGTSVEQYEVLLFSALMPSWWLCRWQARSCIMRDLHNWTFHFLCKLLQQKIFCADLV